MSIVAETVSLVRGYRRAAVVIVLLGAIATAGVISARALASGGPDGQAGIDLPELPAAGGALMWTGQSQSPAMTQARGLGDLLSLVSGLAWLGFAVASFSILSCYAVQQRRRAFEIGIRRAVGASLRRIERSMLLEAAFLGVCAVIVGMSIARVLHGEARRFWPGGVAPVALEGAMPALVLLCVLGGCAWFTWRGVRAQRLIASDAQPVGLRIPTCQVAVSVALLLLSAALLRQRERVGTTQMSRADEDALVLTIDSGIAVPAARAARYASIERGLSNDAGVGGVGLASGGALIGLGTINAIFTDCGQCFLGQVVVRWPEFNAVVHAVSPGLLAGSASRVVAGRAFREDDQPGAPLVAIVNRALADRYYEKGRALGRAIFLGSGRYTVVGVVDDERRSPAIGGALQPRETVYVSLFQRPPRQVNLIVHGAGTSPQARNEVVATVRRTLGPQGAVLGVALAKDLEGAERQASAWCGRVSAVMTVLVLLLALAGTVTTTTIWADSMAWELALRRAVGASRGRILSLVLSRVAGIGIGGVTLGIYIYASVLGPALSGSIAGIALPHVGALPWIVLIPPLLAVVAGAIPGARFAWGPPSAILG